ncbi:10263_t:CDS:2, partial [Dentiscutata heterogama]
ECTKVEELEQKNTELEARLAVVKQSSVVVNRQPQNNEKVILEMLPEVFTNNNSIVDQLKQHDVTPDLSPDTETLVDSKLSLSIDNNISALSSIEKVVSKETPDNLSCDTKIITCTDSKDAPSNEISISSVASVELHDESTLNNAIEGSMQRLAYWIDEAIKMGLKEILYLYHYSFEFEEKVKNIIADGKTKDKTARSMIYKDMLQKRGWD